VTDPGRQLHLNVTMMGAGYYPSAWRLPEIDAPGLLGIDHYRRCAQIAERGRLDAIFFADGPILGDLSWQPPMTPLEPTVLLTSVAAVTEHIGLIATGSTTYEEPYNLARRFASLDIVSGGRAGWNIVSTSAPAVAANFGPRSHPTHHERYAMAEEFVQVVRALWRSWDDDAVIGDKEAGRYADVSRIRRIDHRGKRYEVAGPLNVAPSLQGHPVLVQAGASGPGRALGARHADVIFTSQRDLDQAVAFNADVRRIAAEAGRDPAAITILPGLVTILGGTEAEARSRRAELEDLLDHQRALEFLAPVLEITAEDLALDEPLPAALLRDQNEISASQSLYADTVGVALRDNLTVRQLIDALAGRWGHPVIAGTPEQIADRIERWFRAGAADGFNLMPDVYPSGLEAFVDHVVPVLRHRGLFREEYTGSTLRDHYGLPRPAAPRVSA
jgi:FMN-dependent oxidoreductase (nitrilotriacetate monooxygenase family)